MLRRLKRLIPDRHPARLLWHRSKAFAAAAKFGFPARALIVIGITGTDGKTTSVAMTAHILNTCGIPAGAVSTSFFQIRGKTEENPTHKTSLSPFVLQRFLRRCVHERCTVAVVEASSHGLVQHRLDFLWPEAAAITNLSPEHLDYHGSLEQYRRDKAILFRMLQGKGTKILNRADETYAAYVTIPSSRTIAYSSTPFVPNTGETALWFTDIRSDVRSCSATLHWQAPAEGGTHSGHHDLTIALPGVFNLENALCALSSAHAVGVNLAQGMDALRTFSGVPGRLERIDEGQSFSVFVDFAVTPRAYEAALTAVSRTLGPGQRLLVLASSCGDRMREKRPLIGKTCSALADVVVVTEDETLTEDPLRVIEEVWAGVDLSHTQAHRIPDRRDAIRFLLGQAKAGDAVVLCGIGACTTMQTREGLRPWDEREIVRGMLRELRSPD